MAMMAWSLTNKEQAQVREYFLALDRNHDGLISLEDLRQALAKVQDDSNATAELSEALQQCEERGEEWDIHYSDFLAAMTCSQIELDEDLLQMAFHKFDRRGVGEISKEDLRELLGESYEGSDVDCLIEEAGLPPSFSLAFDDFTSCVKNGREALGMQRQELSFEELAFGEQWTSEGQQVAPSQSFAAEKNCSEKTMTIPQRPRLTEAAYQTARVLNVSETFPPKASHRPCCSVQ